MEILTGEQMRAADRHAIEALGIPSLELMEAAGAGIAAELLRRDPDLRQKTVTVVCGKGNNGGDGLVIARTLWNHGVAARVFCVGPLAKLDESSEDVRTNARLWRGLGRRIHAIETVEAVETLRAELAEAELVVDALFGTGLVRPLREPWAAAVRSVNACGRPVLAVDLPSGLDANTGAVLGEAVHADTTVTFVARKPGFTRDAGPEHCGRVVVAEIGIPRAFVQEP